MAGKENVKISTEDGSQQRGTLRPRASNTLSDLAFDMLKGERPSKAKVRPVTVTVRPRHKTWRPVRLDGSIRKFEDFDPSLHEAEPALQLAGEDVYVGDLCLFSRGAREWLSSEHSKHEGYCGVSVLRGRYEVLHSSVEEHLYVVEAASGQRCRFACDSGLICAIRKADLDEMGGPACLETASYALVSGVSGELRVCKDGLFGGALSMRIM